MERAEDDFPLGILKNFQNQKLVEQISGNPLLSQIVRFQSPVVSKCMLTRSKTLPRPFRVRGYAAQLNNPLLSETVRNRPKVSGGWDMYASEVNFPLGISKNFKIYKSVKRISGIPLVSQSVRFQTPGVSKYMVTRSKTLPRPF
jgi:hypothetical protein